jgi:AraC-like DNA-binding protein
MKAEICEPNHRGETAEAYRVAVQKVIRHMKSRLDQPLDLEEIARVAMISKFHLVRVFDELTGTTPHHFLACLRIQKAKELLLASNATITEICLEVGYISLGSFSKTFSTLVGLSPLEFRALPKRLSALQFAAAIWRFLGARQKFSGPQLHGTVEGPSKPRGFIFVGTFIRGVPQGVPYSGTVLLSRGTFHVNRPAVDEFHLMAVLVPFSANLRAMVTNLPVGLVASLRLRNKDELNNAEKPCLRLRPIRPTDPPIVLALPALPPLLA